MGSNDEDRPTSTGSPRITLKFGDHEVELAEGGIHVSAETSRRLSCDASVVVMREGADGTVLDVGRKTRTIPTAIRSKT